MRFAIFLAVLFLLPAYVVVLEWNYVHFQQPKLLAQCQARLNEAGLGGLQVSLDHFDARLTGVCQSPDDRERARAVVESLPGLRVRDEDHLVTVPAQLQSRLEDGVLRLEGWLPTETARRLIAAMAVSCAIAMWWFAPAGEGTVAMAGATATSAATTATTAPAMFGHGLTAGLVTFGGAYTAIPYVATVATGDHGWMTRGELLDGVALASVLPAPLVIFGTFVGFRGAGLAGALAFTAGIFLPAFSFTLIGFGAIERLLAWKPARRALDLASAIAIGLIVGAALHIVLDALGGWPLTNLGATRFGIATPIAFAALVALVFRVRSHGAVPAIVVGAGVLGAAFGAISSGALAK